MPSSEFTQWVAFYELEPFGTWRDNWHMAVLAQMYASAHSKRPPKFSSFFYLDPAVQASNERKAMMAKLDSMVK